MCTISFMLRLLLTFREDSGMAIGVHNILHAATGEAIWKLRTNSCPGVYTTGVASAFVFAKTDVSFCTSSMA